MGFIDRILQEPSYGWANEKGDLIKPSLLTLYKEAFSNTNIFKTKKNWIPFITWFMAIAMLPFFIFFLFKYISIPLVIAFAIYAMFVMGTHGTIWFHRFCTHSAYQFRHPIIRFITQNLTIKTFPEEVYVVSHHVHHAKSDKPGDPYNPMGGLMYCMLSDVNHQSIAKNLSEEDYNRVAGFLKHTGIQINSYKAYQVWGSVATPAYTIALWLGNWAFWYAAFYFLGGHALACTFFSAALFWFVLVRAFNYTGHGKGQEKHVDGIDFDRRNLSINQLRPGYFAGEWHNNHHLYPASARAGFLPYQLDLAWIYIICLYKLGLVVSYKDNKKDFFKKYINQPSNGFDH
ncbi:MAG TPA: fatty acid desaturase [Ferruginibacter sp.]|nr:fatty acid desaturase [Ferruginibacter sp.]HRE62492.1 fatty acid desaturase [Ferruginibacter sp.]